MSAVVRAFATALRERHRRFARAAGIDRSEFAAITFVQRFGSSLNLNVHLHVVVVDGVFSRDPSGALLFTPAPAPSAAEMLATLRSVRARVARLAPSVTLAAPLAACAQLALARGELCMRRKDKGLRVRPPGFTDVPYLNLGASNTDAEDD